eukprot:316158_1
MATVTATNEAEDKQQTIRDLFRNKFYQRILIFTCCQALFGIMQDMIMPAFGGRFFSENCNNDNNTDCDYNYTTYNLYDSIFGSIRGLIGFLMSGALGAASDHYGRKPFLLITTVLALINFASMSFLLNIWIYWALITLQRGLFGNTQILSFLETAYIDDITHKHQKTVAFTIIAGCMSFCLLIGSGSASFITSMWNIWTVFVFMAVIYCFLTIYVLFFLKESRNQKHMHTYTNKKRNRNPLKPLTYITKHPIIFWLVIVGVITSVSTMSLSVMLVYLNDQINVNNDANSTMLNLGVYGTMAISCLIVAGFIVPCLKTHKCSFATDINLIIIGTVFLSLSSLSISIISFITNDDSNNSNVMIYCIVIIIVSSSFLGGIAFVHPASSSIISKTVNRNERGMVFGIRRAYTAMMSIVGPFALGYGYNVSKQYLDFPSLIWYIVACLQIISLLIAVGPLKSNIKKYEGMDETFSFLSRDDDQNILLELK